MPPGKLTEATFEASVGAPAGKLSEVSFTAASGPPQGKLTDATFGGDGSGPVGPDVSLGWLGVGGSWVKVNGYLGVSGAWVPVTRYTGSGSPVGPEVSGLLPAGSMARPSGANYVRYEDVRVAGDTLQQTLNRVTGNRILTLPPGEFLISDFANGYKDGVRVGGGGATGCRGIAGSGPDQTIIKLVAGSSTQAGFVAGLGGLSANPLFVVNASGSAGNLLTGVEFSNFKLEGTLQPSDHCFGGLRLEYCTNPLVKNVLIVAIKGAANVPPGETMSISLYQGSGTFINHCEIDGRRSGSRVGASGIGYNATRGVTTNYTYIHHSLSGGGGHAYWHCDDSTSLNCRCEYIGSGTGTLAGYCFNHEESNNIVHTNPVCICDRGGTGPGNLHMSLNSNTVDTSLTVINPTWDAQVAGGGLFCVERWSVSTPQVSKPHVFKADGVTPLPFAAIGFP